MISAACGGVSRLWLFATALVWLGFGLLSSPAQAPKERARLAGHKGQVLALHFSMDGRAISSTDRTGTIKLWDAVAGKELATPHKSGITVAMDATFSADGKQMILGKPGGLIELWDVHLGKRVKTFQGETNNIAGLALSADGKLLAAGNWGGNAQLWDVRTEKVSTQWKGYDRPVVGLVMSRDAKLLAMAGDKTVKVWDVATGKERFTLPHDAFLECLTLSPDEKLLASFGDGIKLHDPTSGKLIRTIQTDMKIKSLAFSPTSKALAAGDLSGDVAIWDATNGKLIGRTELAVESHALRLAFSSDGRTLASGHFRGTIVLWDVGGRK